MDQLLHIIQKLRKECPWDQAQTPQTLTRYAIEEAYEVEAAIQSGDAQHVKEELGDLLLQVVFQSQMYSEQNTFNFQDVVDAIVEKLIRRHPHVFEKEKFMHLSKEDVEKLWKDIKVKEKQGQPYQRLNEVKHGSAIVQAQEIQENTAKIGFDFPDVTGAYEKLEEELEELQTAIKNLNDEEICDEFGDCLFSLINVGRKLGVSSEMALLKTIYKFRTRFAYIEDCARLQNKNIEQMSLVEMDQLWDQAKQYLKQQKERQQAQQHGNHTNE
ncbi:nucleoside triphosphate pyrophosphohydrolase [Acinetobacter sp. ANC 4558]|uniref:nucleoside triphosphate pyrophosphohydrolase n=1 Tax=Acinetobacter sp. ANC 4558 TaxID=1977876 RepID=UPI000A35513F|nr:nucleoside triphosphate pyrophosphohydrolase [Acinetobacter sp. ANC 4558]OTG86625.1 nucleoside triphosphate pyrophosphohydrolase [Acinetobacter sp. ANC 4558]